jgi:hypothetical protein
MPTRRFQFGLADLMLLTTVVAVLSRFYHGLLVMLVFPPLLPVAMCLYILLYGDATAERDARQASRRRFSVERAAYWAVALLALVGLDLCYDAIMPASETPAPSGTAPPAAVSGQPAAADVAAHQQHAEEVFESAMRKLENHEVVAAKELLTRYITDPYAVRKTEAARLAAEAETAISFDSAWNSLAAMDDAEFNSALSTRFIADGKVTHPIVVAERSKTISRCLPVVARYRQALRGDTGRE